MSTPLTQNGGSKLNLRWVTDPPIRQLSKVETGIEIGRLKNNLDWWGTVEDADLDPPEKAGSKRAQQEQWKNRISSTQTMLEKDFSRKKNFGYFVDGHPVGLMSIAHIGSDNSFYICDLVTHPGSAEAGGVLIEHAAQWSADHEGSGKLELWALNDDARLAYVALGFESVPGEDPRSMRLDPSQATGIWCKLGDKWRISKHIGKKYIG